MVHLICVNCSHPNAPEAKFCGECGAGLLRRFCQTCRAINNAESHYCHSCGAQLPLPVPVAAPVASDDAVQAAGPRAVAQTGCPPTRAHRRAGGRGQRGADAQMAAYEGPARLQVDAERPVEQTVREAAAAPAVEMTSNVFEWPQVRAGGQVIEMPTGASPTAIPASLSIDPPQRRLGKGAKLAAAALLAAMAGTGLWLMSARQSSPVGTQTSAQPSNAAITGVALPAAAAADVPKPQSAAVADKPITPDGAGADKAAERRADDKPAAVPKPRPVAATPRRPPAAAVLATARPRETSTECTPTTDALGLCKLKINSEGR